MLKGQIIELQQVKNIQINDAKTQMSQEIQNLKRGNLNSLESAELEIRKLKDICDSKEYEISELTLKFNRYIKDAEF